MRSPVIRLIAVALILCLVGISGLLYPQTVAHAAQHESHHHGTHTGHMGHGTALCTWMCAAGQGIESLPVTFTTQLQPLASLPSHVEEEPASLVGSFTASRGPPVRSA